MQTVPPRTLLLDANILSYARSAGLTLAAAVGCDPARLAIPLIALTECLGSVSETHPRRAEYLRLIQDVAISDTTTPPVVARAAQLVDRYARHGPALADMLIAAAAIEHSMTLVSTNWSDFHFVHDLWLLDARYLTTDRAHTGHPGARTRTLARSGASRTALLPRPGRRRRTPQTPSAPPRELMRGLHSAERHVRLWFLVSTLSAGIALATALSFQTGTLAVIDGQVDLRACGTYVDLPTLGRLWGERLLLRTLWRGRPVTVPLSQVPAGTALLITEGGPRRHFWLVRDDRGIDAFRATPAAFLLHEEDVQFRARWTGTAWEAQTTQDPGRSVFFYHRIAHTFDRDGRLISVQPTATSTASRCGCWPIE